MSVLFSPLSLRSLEIANRVWMSPMCMFSASPSGSDIAAPTGFHFAHLVSRAAGGAGLIMAEATAVHPAGRISPYDLGLWNDEQQHAFAHIAQAIKAHGTTPAIQLAHAGRKASLDKPWLGKLPLDKDRHGWTPVGPSTAPYPGLLDPQELTVDEIGRTVEDFAASAERALAAGFEVVELHGAHGYLIHSFLSPAANHRTDRYGGPFENRIRFALEVVDAVRSVWPEHLPVFFRASATDWLVEDGHEGWSAEDTVALTKELQAHGIDLLDVSTGGMAPANIPIEPGYQVGFAEQIRRQSGMPTAAIGLITEPMQAEEILVDGRADAVMLGRQLLREPYWAHRAADELGETPRWPEQYGYAVTRRHHSRW